MLDDEIDAGTKAGKKPSGFFHFRNDPPPPSAPTRAISVFLSWMRYGIKEELIKLN